MPPHTPESEALGRTQGSACLQPWETLMHTGDCCLREPPERAGVWTSTRQSAPLRR